MAESPVVNKKFGTPISSSSSSKAALKVEFDREKFGPPEIEPDELIYLERIGGGCFGNVFRGMCRGQEVAIKKFFRQDLSAKAINDFKKEVEICMHVGGHPNVLLFMGACTVPGHLAMVMELMPKGNLEHMLHNPQYDLSLVRRLSMAKEVAKGMTWLHCSHPMIIHRDLKPSNLLVDSHGHIRVCDFGLSAIKPDDMEKLQDEDSIPGTPLWMAPEVLSGRPLDEKADVYAFGIVLWEIVTRKAPFPEMKNFHVFKRAICVDNVRPPIPEDITSSYPSLAALLEACWQANPRLRPKFQEIIDMLDEIMIESAILGAEDEPARQMWKREFLSKEFVEWNEFYPHFYQLIGQTAPAPGGQQFASLNEERKYLCTKTLLAQKSPLGVGNMMREPPEVVTLEGFGQYLGWFGPATSPSVEGSGAAAESEPSDATPAAEAAPAAAESSESKKPAAPREVDILTRVMRICKQSWFYGNTDLETAENILRGCNEGTYLVRLNTKIHGVYTLSKVTQMKKIAHQRFYYKPNQGYTISLPDAEGKSILVRSKPGKSLRSFIKMLESDLFLIKPCGVSRPFQQIFDKVKTFGSQGYLPD